MNRKALTAIFLGAALACVGGTSLAAEAGKSKAAKMAGLGIQGNKITKIHPK